LEDKKPEESGKPELKNSDKHYEQFFSNEEMKYLKRQFLLFSSDGVIIP